MPEATITKSIAVLTRSSTIQNVVTFVSEFEDTHQIRQTIMFTIQDWEALGSPELVTVTIEPGDKLNEEKV